MQRRFLVYVVIIVCVFISALGQPPTPTYAGFTVYLTFDDGPYPGRTEAVLNVLQKYGVKATFFVNGGRIARGPHTYATVQRVMRDGHRLGNHLWLHFNDIMFTAKPSTEKMVDQFNQTEHMIQEALGTELWQQYNSQPKIFRWPGGSPFPMPGMPNVISYNWHATSGMNPTVQHAINNVLYGLPEAHEYGVYAWGDGAIVLFHDTVPNTALALPAIIENLRAHGATFGVLPRPGDQPGTVIAELGGVPPCAHQPGNCFKENQIGVLPPK